MEKKQKTGEHARPSKKISLLTKEEKKKVVRDFHGLNPKDYPPFRLGCLVVTPSESPIDLLGLKPLQDLYNEEYGQETEDSPALPIMCVQPQFFARMLATDSISGVEMQNQGHIETAAWQKFLSSGNNRETLVNEIDKWISYNKRTPGKIGEEFVNGWLFLYEPWEISREAMFCRPLLMVIRSERVNTASFACLYWSLLLNIHSEWSALKNYISPMVSISYRRYMESTDDSAREEKEKEDNIDYAIDCLWFHLAYPEKTTTEQQLALFKMVYFYGSSSWLEDEGTPATISRRIKGDFKAFAKENRWFLESLDDQVLFLPSNSYEDEMGATVLTGHFPHQATFQEKKYSFTEQDITAWYKEFVPFVQERLKKGLAPVEIHSFDQWETKWRAGFRTDTKHIDEKISDLYALVTKTSPFWHDKDVYAARERVRSLCDEQMFNADRYRILAEDSHASTSIEQLERALLLSDAPESSNTWKTIRSDLKECKERSRTLTVQDLSRMDSALAFNRAMWPTAAGLLRYCIDVQPNRRWEDRSVDAPRHVIMNISANKAGKHHDYLRRIHNMVSENHPLMRKVNVPVLRSKIPDRLLQEHLATFLGPFRRGDKYYECGHGNLQFVCLTCKRAFYCSIECQREHCEKGGHACY